ncbi:MAG: 4'-phosphopantetheinyl transferase superfamily protein [Shewanella algae]
MEPPINAVQLFLYPLRQSEPLKIKDLALCLTPAERERFARISHKEVKQRAITSRALLRQTLSTQAPLAAREWCFDYGPQGKPRLCDEQFQQTQLHFNLSHSGDWLLLALLKHPSPELQLGVDIERLRMRTAIDTVMRHYFAPFELQQLRNLDDATRREAFFDLWALKESYIKATGKGLAQPLDGFAFDLSSGEACSDERPAEIVSMRRGLLLKPKENTQWQSWLGHMEPGYRLALTLWAPAAINWQLQWHLGQ